MPPPPVEPRRGPSTTNKVFLGCAIAALAMGLVSIVVVGSAVWWAVSPGRQLPTAMAVGPATGGVVRFGDLGADDGMSTFIATFLEESERARPGNPDLPPWMRTWLRSSRAEGFKQWLPREGTLSLERTADGLLHPVAALNLRTYVRPMRIFMEKMGDDRRVATRSQHRGETLVVFEGGTTLCFVGGTLLVSGDADLVRGVIDRAAAMPASPPALPPSLSTLGDGWDVYGSMTDPEAAAGLLSRLLAQVPEMEDADVPRQLTARFGVDAQKGDQLRGMLEVTFASEAEAAAAESEVQVYLDRQRERAQATGVVLQAVPQRYGDRITIDVDARGLAAAAGRHSATTSRRSGRRTGF